MVRMLAFSIVALAVSAPAGAVTIVNNTAQLTSADINKSFTVTTDGSTAGSDGLFGQLVFKLTNVTTVGSDTKFEFDYSVTNTSIAPAANSRLGQVGFDISGTPGVADVASDYFQLAGNNNGNFNGLGGREICLTVANNCSGAGNAGIEAGIANTKLGKLIFTYANATQSITFSNFVTRWQAGQGGASASGGGVITAIPEPATWAMMIGGFGLIGAAMRRRKRVAASFG